MFRREVDRLVLFTEEGDDRKLRVFVRDDPKLIPEMHLAVRGGGGDDSVVKDAAADKRPVDDVAEFFKRPAGERLIRYRHVVVDRSRGELHLMLGPGFVLRRDIDVEGFLKEQNRENHRDDGNRIGAGVPHRDIGVVPHRVQRLLGRAETRCARHRAEVNAHHLRETDVALKNEERRPHLQSDKEYEEDEAEILEERDEVRVHLKAKPAEDEPEEQHPGRPKRHAENLDAAKRQPERDHKRIHHHPVAETRWIEKQVTKPRHNRYFTPSKSDDLFFP